MVEDDQRAGEDQGEIGQTEIVRRRIGKSFELPHAVVTDEADGPAVEGRQLVERGAL